ncbi:MAG: hypothetical protein KUG77_03550 [Nannocystaceae bacterium]|nr:hypothetical protein [Nannocystaceae bacterium]
MPDLIDIEPRYVDDRNLEGWERLIAWFFQTHVFNRLVPSQGQVVEMGVARGINFARLCEMFGAQRCEGFDVVNYPSHPRVRTIDVRTLGTRDDRPIALAWNDLSSWEHSPASKRAGFDFLTRNLVEEGLYVDADFEPDTIGTLDLRGLELVVDTRLIKMWRRVGSSISLPHEDLLPGEPPLAWWQWLNRHQRLDCTPTRLALPAEFSHSPQTSDISSVEGHINGVFRNLGILDGFASGSTRKWWHGGDCGPSAAPRVVVHLGPTSREVVLGDHRWNLEPGHLMFLPAGCEATSADQGLSSVVVPLPDN